VPFFLARNGTFLMGQVGDTHWDVPGYEVGSGYWLGKQGQVNFDPETGAEAAMWPVDESTLRTAPWVTAEMQGRVVAEARQRWRCHLARERLRVGRPDSQPRQGDRAAGPSRLTGPRRTRRA
jgi:hypothetical protein